MHFNLIDRIRVAIYSTWKEVCCSPRRYSSTCVWRLRCKSYDISRPYSQSFSYRQHRDNCLVGALLWRIGAVLLLIVKFMPSDLRRSTALIL